MFRKFFLVVLAILMFVVAACSDAPTPAPTPEPKATATSAPTAAPQAAAAPTKAAAGDTVKLVVVPAQSEARYRVREQLAGVSLPSDAIGATKEITGTIVGKLDGTIVSAQSKFRVDLRTLQSDQDRRDNFLRRNVLETDKFPFAEFVPIEAPGLPLKLPADGQVEFKLVGDMTIRDVTKRVTWDAKGTVEGDVATGRATTRFNFAFFNLTQPRVPLVLSIEDNIQLELDLRLQRVFD